MRCVEAAVKGPWEHGIAVERAELQKVLNGPQSAALRHVFMAECTAQKIAGIERDTPVRNIASVGIVGAGTMGTGIAIAFLDAGYPVTIIDRNENALEAGGARIAGDFERRVSRGKLSQDKANAAISALDMATGIETLAKADLIVEAMFEDLSIKQEIFRQIGAIAADGAILATNTSFLDVNAIADASGRPADVLGLHFFTPANIMRLLEIVRAEKTAADVLATAMAVARRMRKAPVIAGVCHGFIGSRMLETRQDQADAMLMEGVSPWDIDRVPVDFGFSMGPYQMFDLVGLDVLSRADNGTLAGALVSQGKLGQKSGAGYYDYDGRTPFPLRRTEATIVERGGPAPGSATFDDAQILDRLLLPTFNEGARILEEGIAARGSDIDLVWVTGFSWPAHTAGPMFHADAIGLPLVVERLETIEGISISPLLRRIASENSSLSGYAGRG